MNLEARPSRNGTGVFAIAPITRGSIVWDWSDCRQYTSTQIPVPYGKDEYLQVAKNLYLGPDGTPEDAGDFINHSCDPNCKIEIALPSIRLIAVRDIGIGEEIGYDYAVTLYDDLWEMKCNCGTTKCRGVIRELKVKP